MNRKKVFNLISAIFFVLLLQLSANHVLALTSIGQLTSMRVSDQQGSLTYGTAGSVTYDLTALGNATFYTNWSIINLPPGIGAYFSATSSLGNGFWTTQLTLVSSDTAPDPGTFNFAVQAIRADNTDISIFKNISFQVLKKPINPHLIVANKVYDATTAASSTCAFPDKVGTDDIVCSLTDSSFLSSDAGNNVPVDGTGISMSGTNSDKYILIGDSATGTATISKKNQSVSFTVPADITYMPNTTIEIKDATSTSDLPVSFRSGGSCTVSGNIISIVSAGICFISATQIGDLNYNATTFNTGNDSDGEQRSRFNVFKSTQTVNFLQPDLKAKYGDDPIVLSATSSSEFQVVFRTSGACLVSGNKLSFISGGTCTVVASVPANPKYNASNEIKYLINVSKANQTISISFPTLTPVLKSSPISLNGIATSKLPVTYRTSGICNVSGNNLDLIARGSCVIVAVQAGNSQYSVAPEVRTVLMVK